MEDHAFKRVSIQQKIRIDPVGLNHHTSMQYRASFFSKQPIFKRNSSSQIIHVQQINKQQIFGLVYRFIGGLVTNSAYTQSILKQLKFNTEQMLISVSKLSDFDSQKQNSVSSISSKGTFPQLASASFESVENIQIQAPTIKITQVSLQEENKKKEARQPKISIMVGSFSDFSVGSGSKISCSSIVNISLIKFPPNILTVDLIKRIFQQPQPFLINLAVCLMLKFLFYSRIPISLANACWILSIATIISYKIYYDDPVEGLVQSFAEILKIKPKQIRDLQRYFLDQISFQAVVTSQQYQIMLSKIVAA